MPKVLAYQCPFTQKIFALSNKEEYIEHLKTVRKKHMQIRNNALAKREWLEFLDEGRETVCCIEDLGRWIIDNSAIIGNHARRTHSINKPLDNFGVKSIKFIRPSYSTSCSNSHSAPRGKRTNWGGEHKDDPRGYPGITFTIDLNIGGISNGYVHDIFSSVNVYLGGGSGRGHNRHVYACTVWLEDWPRLEESISAALLSGKKYNRVDEIIVVENP